MAVSRTTAALIASPVVGLVAGVFIDLIRHDGHPEAFTANDDDRLISIRRVRHDAIVHGLRLDEGRDDKPEFELTLTGDGDGDEGSLSVVLNVRDWDMLTSMVERITRHGRDLNYPADNTLDRHEQELAREREIAARNRAWSASEERKQLRARQE